MSIQDKTRELATLIRESEEYQNLQSAQSRVKLDPNAQDLLTKLQEAQGKLIQMQQSGQAVDEQTVTEMRNLESQMQLNLTLKNLVEAQQAFEKLMGQVNETLSEALR